MKLRDVALDDKYTVEEGRIFLTGTQALVRLPLMQHARDLKMGLKTAGYISGYRSEDRIHRFRCNRKSYQ